MCGHSSAFSPRATTAKRCHVQCRIRQGRVMLPLMLRYFTTGFSNFSYSLKTMDHIAVLNRNSYMFAIKKSEQRTWNRCLLSNIEDLFFSSKIICPFSKTISLVRINAYLDVTALFFKNCYSVDIY